jgi:hypothetical protein
MESEKSYEVVVRKKIPYLTVFLFRLSLFLIIPFFLFYVLILPFQDAPSEVGLTFFNLFLPETMKKIILFSVVGVFVVIILYLELRIYRNAIVIFRGKEVDIVGKSININIKAINLTKVTFMDDSKEVGGKLKEKFIVYLQQRGEKSIRLKLKHYLQAVEFQDEFLPNENIKYEFLNIDFSPDLENEI